MKFSTDHFNINALDLEKSLAFYDKALCLKEESRHTVDDGSYIIIFLRDGITANKFELTWLKSQENPYYLGDKEFHIAFKTPYFDGAYAFHKKMDCI